MFETYQFAGVYIAIQAVLTLYAQGKRKHELESFLAMIHLFKNFRDAASKPFFLEFMTKLLAVGIKFSTCVWFLLVYQANSVDV